MLKKLASETAIYGISTILGRLINYTLVGLHTNVLTEGSYGVVAIFYSLAAFLNVLYTYGMETSFFRFASKEDSDPQKWYSSALSSLIISTAIFSGSIILLAPQIGSMLGYENSEKYVIWFALLIAIDTIVALPFAKLRIQKKAKKFATIKIVNILITVGLNFFFFWFCADVHSGEYLIELRPLINSFYNPELGLGYAFLANLLSNALLIPLLYKELFQFRFTFDWAILKKLYKYAYPLVFSGLFFAINELLDRILLEAWLPTGFYPNADDTAAVGVYSACYKLSIFISLAIQAYKYAAEPFFFGNANNKQNKEIFAQSTKFFIIATLAMFVGVSMNLDWLGGLFLRGKGFREGLGVVPFLLMANVCLGVYYNLSIWFKITDRTHFGALIGGIGALITLTANYFLIPVLGYHGSAIATICCYGSMMVLCYLFGQKHYPVNYDLKSASFYALLAIALVALSFYQPYQAFWEKIAINNSLVIVYLILIYLKERKAVLSLMRK